MHAIENFGENILSSFDPNEAYLAIKDYFRNGDTISFSEAVEEAKPSSELAYWAKKSCKHCYGFGVAGIRHVFEEPARSDSKNGYLNSKISNIECRCVEKRYNVWLKHFREFYYSEKEEKERGADE